MKTKTNNSLFTDIKIDKAANVNGGYYFPDWEYYFETYSNIYTQPGPHQRLDSIGAVDTRVGGILSTLRWL